ncbi:Saccharopine dehydrogenase [NAD(+), L-lysine-forming] [Neolecta irregularis DAH-3]|uniref:Saccharopine dehydrogenase [NAD(+), L-lysine-forming] n=1 Tax=Neolecta irregularis (strain DAH-3) TaxID=1198029 RepID=A0A1U7LKE5_NEOID|nr:Saccharopine dehydrogenase [NAD(+), L-lysine-forming] [Neolecta irregularis DAH-3]|eukprot:OLL23124.1 Saccharopine dehydrogenase [NAD(+), L-lysine-forming] [Neolecta irregularis DAH-3]
MASDSVHPHLWLRAETKIAEHRSALTPTTASELLKHGFKVSVERSDQRIFKDSEFEKAGLELVPFSSWREAPKYAYVIGLKELPENDNSPLIHNHIMFAHCYKQQSGWKNILKRWQEGGGTLYDLEFLENDGRRVAAFGFHAGFTGSALGIEVWAWQILHPREEYGSVIPSPSEDHLVQKVQKSLKAALKANNGQYPRVIVMGALGRCGSGAVDFANKVGIPEEQILKWDMAETAKGGPFKEITESDIFVNCIYLKTPIPPFITPETIDLPSRKLSVIVDVSCDTTNSYNPIPIYSINTTFERPTVSVAAKAKPRLSIISIDHLPTLLPREASESFSSSLLPSLLQLKHVTSAKVWTDAERIFRENIAMLQ